MAKKKVEVPLTREESIAQAFDRNIYAVEDCPICPEHCIINVGDELEVGNLIDVVAAAISQDNRFIVIETHDKGTKYGVPYDEGRNIRGAWPWYAVRRKSEITKTNFFDASQGAKALDRGQRSISDIRGLLSGAVRRGFFCDPMYQRGYVWTDADRERLLDSLFRGLGIGEFVFISDREGGDYRYEVLDGQQRLTTLYDFFLNKFTYRGKYWNQLSKSDQNQFENVRSSWVELNGRYLTPKLKAEMFLIVNDSGVPQTQEHLQKIRDHLKNS